MSAMPNLLSMPQPTDCPSRSDGGRGWNDTVQRSDDISFQINEIFEPGRNSYQVTAVPGPDQRTRVTQAHRDRAQLEGVEKRAKGIAARRERKRDHAPAAKFTGAEQGRGQRMTRVRA